MFCRTRTRSLSNATFSLLITWRSSSLKSAAAYKTSSKSDDFSLRYGDNDFQNGGRPPSWDCFTTIRDHPRSLCCWQQLPVKFHVNLIHRSEDLAIWIFRILCLKCLLRPPKIGVLMYSTNLLLCLTVFFNLIFNVWQLLEHFVVPLCLVQLSHYSLLISLF